MIHRQMDGRGALSIPFWKVWRTPLETGIMSAVITFD
jgi:hypothetical protein